jgi:septal ring factor EnvC (AmiA/AmiB activator)
VSSGALLVTAQGPAADSAATELAACRAELARCREELDAVKKENARLLKQCGTLRDIISDIHRRTSAGFLE